MLAWGGSKYPHFKEAISHLAGADPRGVNWVASHLLWVCSVHNTNCFFERSDLLEQTILVNKVYDKMQINHSDREQSTGHLEQESQTT